MRFGDELQVPTPDFGERPTTADTEHDIGIAFDPDDVSFRNPFEGRALDAEDPGDALEIDELRLVHGAVGAGNREKPVDDVGQPADIVAVDAGNLRGIGFEPGDVTLGEIEGD
jgi:hypothetical protein